jgi:hypothetical protein
VVMSAARGSDLLQQCENVTSLYFDIVMTSISFKKNITKVFFYLVWPHHVVHVLVQAQPVQFHPLHALQLKYGELQLMFTICNAIHKIVAYE